MQVIILMGVSGVGKTTIGLLLAKELDLPFYDADDFHPDENVRKMKAGIPLTDADRLSWLEALALKIREWGKDEGAVLACSALKEEYRAHLKTYTDQIPTWVFLYADYEVIYNRLLQRKNHYFKTNLLRSQYNTLQTPDYGIHIDVNASIEEVLEKLLASLRQPKVNSQMGLIGLGVMGKSLSLNILDKGISLSVYNRQFGQQEVDVAKNFAESQAEYYDIPFFDEVKPFLASLKTPRVVFLMVNAGKAVDAVIADLLPFLEPGDLIIDGGNSHYHDTRRREKELKEKKFLFMGVGISGGEEGARNGPSIMPGGPESSYEIAGPILEKIAARDKDGRPCCTYVGPDGAGHFVKMLHNGIEYGEMQLIAETYYYLRFFSGFSPEKIARIFRDWNTSQKSYLLEISADILIHKENGEPLIDYILDAAKQKGTGSWSTNAALELGVPFDTITAAVMARNLSSRKEDRVKAEEIYQNGLVKTVKKQVNVEELFQAYRAASIVNHAIGFDLLREASNEYKWNLDLSELARIWTNGCIIRSKFMEELAELFKGKNKELLLLQPIISKQLMEYEPAMLQILSQALLQGCPMPGLSSAVNYFLSFTSGQSSANMIQAQRDYFGAHTYERTDKARGEFFHTEWLKKK